MEEKIRIFWISIENPYQNSDLVTLRPPQLGYFKNQNHSAIYGEISEHT